MKHSKQRDAILDVLMNTTEHPTADTVYDAVREVIPNISLGTVYRNLGLLAKTGQILKIDVGFEHSCYDGNCSPHDHFVCRGCHRVFDVPGEYDFGIDRECALLIDGKIEYHTLVLYGLCGDCCEKSNIDL